MFSVEFSEAAAENFNALDKPFQARIVKKLREIQSNPEHYIKTLTYSPYDKIRIGDYRLLVEYNKQENRIYIRELDHRKRIYK